MASQIATQSKIDKCVDNFIEPFRKEKEEIKVNLKKLVSNLILNELPQDVQEIHKKYPELLSTSREINLKAKEEKSYYTLCIYPNTPELKRVGFDELKVKVIKEKVVGNKEVTSMVDRYYQIKQDEVTMANKIRCTLSKLKTYKRIQDNFPEAYKFLVEVVDKQGPGASEGNLCDNIENLRAQINKNNTSKASK